MGVRMNRGRWTHEEHQAFLRGIQLHDRQWEAVAALVPTRTVLQIRTHSQKYFAKIERGEPFPDQPYPSQYDPASGKASALAGAFMYIPSSSSPPPPQLQPARGHGTTMHGTAASGESNGIVQGILLPQQHYGGPGGGGTLGGSGGGGVEPGGGYPSHMMGGEQQRTAAAAAAAAAAFVGSVNCSDRPGTCFGTPSTVAPSSIALAAAPPSVANSGNVSGYGHGYAGPAPTASATCSHFWFGNIAPTQLVPTLAAEAMWSTDGGSSEGCSCSGGGGGGGSSQLRNTMFPSIVAASSSLSASAPRSSLSSPASSPSSSAAHASLPSFWGPASASGLASRIASTGSGPELALSGGPDPSAWYSSGGGDGGGCGGGLRPSDGVSHCYGCQPMIVNGMHGSSGIFSVDQQQQQQQQQEVQQEQQRQLLLQLSAFGGFDAALDFTAQPMPPLGEDLSAFEDWVDGSLPSGDDMADGRGNEMGVL